MHGNHLMWLGVYLHIHIIKIIQLLNIVLTTFSWFIYHILPAGVQRYMCISLMGMDYMHIHFLHSRLHIWHMHLLTMVCRLHLSYKTNNSD